ncbi:MAG: nucleotide exchange factor GrpE [Alphaproteobacteria bacterium]
MQDKKENIKETEIETVSINDTKPEISTDKQNEIIEQLNGKIIELNDKYLRTAAELENTRRRAALDVESVSRNRAMGVAEKILPVMDAVQSALKHNPEDDGIKSMQRALENAFAQIGITRIESIGEKLNPQFHNAIQIVDKPNDKTETNTIVEELQTGYMFGDTILRTAMVVVSK